MNTRLSSSSATGGSPFSPFRLPAFAVIWTATVIANIGGWMFSAASGWLMTSLNPDPFIVSLVQVATTLPMFLVAIPAGALVDILDVRKFLIVSESAYTLMGTSKNSSFPPTCANLMREILIRGGDDGSAGIFRCR